MRQVWRTLLRGARFWERWRAVTDVPVLALAAWAVVTGWFSWWTVPLLGVLVLLGPFWVDDVVRLVRGLPPRDFERRR